VLFFTKNDMMMLVPPNCHITNRRVFAAMDVGHPLIKLYNGLIALELALKDFDVSNFARSHDVCEMAVTSFPSNSSVAAAATTLLGDLSALSCSDRRGSPSKVRSNTYPDLRYVRIDSDFALPASPETEIERAVFSLRTLVDELRKEGLPWP
jgi:hypothetical protein